MSFLERVFPKNVYMYPANILGGVVLKLLKGIVKNIERLYAKRWRDDLEKIL